MHISVDEIEIPNVGPAAKGRKRKSFVWDYFTIETVESDCIKACCIQCKRLLAYVTGKKQSGTSHLRRHIMTSCPVKRYNIMDQPPIECKPEPSPTPDILVNQLMIECKPEPSMTPDILVNQLIQCEPEPSITQDILVKVTKPPKKRKVRAVMPTPNLVDVGHNFAKMIIQHDYPLHMAAHTGFIGYAYSLCPKFNVPSLEDVENQIMEIYVKEKQKFMEILDEIPGRISIAMDLWTSDHGMDYVLLTGHFIDKDWKLHRRVLNFLNVPSRDSESVLTSAASACLTDWGLEKKLFSLTSDCLYADETSKQGFRGTLSIKNPFILNGQLLIDSCYARTLSELAQDILASMKDVVDKVRYSVKYVLCSEAHQKSFVGLIESLRIESTRALSIDDLAKWNTTYEMLLAAFELREVFSCLDGFYPDYKSTPSMEEWEIVKALCKYLELFYKSASISTSVVHPTTNIFFDSVCEVKRELMHAAISPDFFIRDLTKPLSERFTKYWNDCNLILAIAVAMDPRFKMKFVELKFSRISAEESDTWISIVRNGLQEVYLEYVVHGIPPPSVSVETFVKTEITEGKEQQEEYFLNDGEFLDVFLSEIMSGEQTKTELDEHMEEKAMSELMSDLMSEDPLKSELDEYLEQPLIPYVKDFDVLDWWRENALRFPTLSRMACDVLCIPVSTQPSYSVFDTSGRNVDSYRSSLKHSTLQALICAKDWLQYESSENVQNC